MKLAIQIVVGLALLVAVVVGTGSLLPVKHTVSRSVLVPMPAHQLWQVLADFGGYASWRKGIVKVDRLPDANGNPVWREVEEDGDGLAYETVSAQAPRKLVRRIAGKDLPFGGTWTFELVPVEAGTQLTLTEDGEVYSPVYRFVSRYVLGYQRSMQTYLDDLAGRLKMPLLSLPS